MISITKAKENDFWWFAVSTMVTGMFGKPQINLPIDKTFGEKLYIYEGLNSH
jgi:hypothetical protein